MKVHSMLLILALVSSSIVHAQVESQAIENEVDAEIDSLYLPQTNKVTQSRSRQGNAVVNQTVVVPQQQSNYQKQPTTFIEASPLSDSKADMIRKNRQNEEMNTETRIVEKLEQSRMEDEKKRAAILFGDKFDNLQNNGSNAAPVQQAPVIQQQPVAPVYIEPKETLSRDAVREEVRAALSEDDMAVSAPVETKYFAGLAGIGEYPDVKNVKGNYAIGAAFGTRYDYMMVEGSFLMSNYSVDLRNYGSARLDNYEVDQYQGAIAAKYQLLGGMVRPVLGGLVAYSYRKFTLTNGIYTQNEDTGNSHAIDLGINAGVDFEFSSRFSLGVEMKYMFNMSSRVTSNYQNSSYGYIGTPIEKLQYYIAGIAARVNF